MNTTLYYFHDPMCSWCYAFSPTLTTLKAGLTGQLGIEYVLGGLAPDDDEPMPESLQQTIQHHWQRIEQTVPGTRFNYDFWTQCRARRSTYPACRSLIAAAQQGQEEAEKMLVAIQHAYYQQARNPSDYSTHIELAKEAGLDVKSFERDLRSEATEKELQRQIAFTHNLGVRGFPTLVLRKEQRYIPIGINYTSAAGMLEEITSHLAAG